MVPLKIISQKRKKQEKLLKVHTLKMSKKN